MLGNTITDDIAIDPTTGILYATTNSGGSTDRLITINKNTGASSNVALISVPDIEGLGTDPTGQLWGTSGTQSILYEINKFTGVGSNGRSINNGSDYESVDCYAISPSVTADLSIGKTVDDASPREGDTVNYSIVVSNLGPGPATVVQVMDVLPSGISFVSATPSQGTYDSFLGQLVRGHRYRPAAAKRCCFVQRSIPAPAAQRSSNTASVDFSARWIPTRRTMPHPSR